MINVGLYYKVKEGHEKEFESIFNEMVKAFKNSDIGFIDGKLYKRVDEPREYLIYSEWKDLESFKNFIKSREFKNATEYGATILENKPYHRIYKEINE
ncbi:MAG: antibiotic biosynthesis monooxygenase family protein [Caldisphaera sp.]|uniref:antibiotic biosynthesis monooxygenase family protein n=1 Tax=Caldisphaera sp. TaxID=2060322 RepID=UPI003D114FC6